MSGGPTASPAGGLGAYSVAMSVAMPLVWSALLAAWPIVLRVWADKLLRERSAAA